MPSWLVGEGDLDAAGEAVFVRVADLVVSPEMLAAINSAIERGGVPVAVEPFELNKLPGIRSMVAQALPLVAALADRAFALRDAGHGTTAPDAHPGLGMQPVLQMGRTLLRLQDKRLQDKKDPHYYLEAAVYGVEVWVGDRFECFYFGSTALEGGLALAAMRTRFRQRARTRYVGDALHKRLVALSAGNAADVDVRVWFVPISAVAGVLGGAATVAHYVEARLINVLWGWSKLSNKTADTTNEISQHVASKGDRGWSWTSRKEQVLAAAVHA